MDPENLKLPPPPIKNLQSITKIMKTDLNKAGQKSSNNSEALDSIMQVARQNFQNNEESLELSNVFQSIFEAFRILPAWSFS